MGVKLVICKFSEKLLRTIVIVLVQFVFVMVLITVLPSTSFAKIEVTLGYLEKKVALPPILSNLEVIPDDEGIAGVNVALNDIRTTGKFLGHDYKLVIDVVDEGEDILDAARVMLSITPFIVVKAPKQVILNISDLPEAKGAIIINISATDDSLRSDECRNNLFHTIPSRAMLSDALAQFSYKKRWHKWALIKGAHDNDSDYALALKRSAKKFQLKIVAELTWEFNADMRRNAAQEVPLFTQDLPDYDLLIVSDERHDFGRYILYNTWLPRPVGGSEGLVPAAWSTAVEQHGAAQLQSRFYNQAKRIMRSIDYAAWAAVRSIGEAVTRSGSNKIEALMTYMLSDKFELGGFKGRKLTFRNWNGQLRQPIPLVHTRAVVALAPIEGFLHQHNELDTLGLDRPESKCREFTKR